MGARCLALAWFTVAFTWPAQAAAEHAPPPPIVLDPPPPPELAPPEYSRRPFELAPELAVGLPSCADGSVDNQVCGGISTGLAGGASVLWRPTPYFAVGATFNLLRFGFHRGQGSELQDRPARASGQFVGVLGRVYFLERGWFDPYLELGLGSAGVTARSSEAEESASGVALRSGGGLEFYLSRHVRLGPAFDWTTFNVKHVQRCSSGRCVDLDETSYGHGTGFSRFALRLSVVLGAGE